MRPIRGFESGQICRASENGPGTRVRDSSLREGAARVEATWKGGRVGTRAKERQRGREGGRRSSLADAMRL